MTTPGFRPTHVVPQHGMPAWEAPDPSRPTVDLDPLLPVQLLERRGDWGHVLCFNGWSAWVDGRGLVAVPQDPPTADGPLTRSADPRPLLGRAQEGLARYRSAVEDLADGLDLESFRTRTRGTRIGVVVDGESVWLYDSAHARWVYADGTRLTTYATDDTPRADRPASEDVPGPSHPQAAPAHPPTRAVAPEPPPVPQDARGPAGAAPPGNASPPQAPEPTRVVAPGAMGVVPPEAPAPTRVVSAQDPLPEPAPAPEPAAVEPPDPAAGPGAPRPEPSASPDAPAPTRLVTARPPEPTRVVGAEEAEEPGGHREADEANETEPPAGAPPTRAVRHAPTRVLPPEGDGR
ncbi:hypothetical protein [Streptomyces djakartensis]|uniref:hypothetical protein n=1 Tax=Streptomyces djakartensis TaxID=68193 RepID=UPI0034DEAEEE